LVDFPGIFHVLLVFTSAFFAVAQYYENRQSKIIEGEQNRLKGIDFALAHANEGMKDVKKKWDDLQVIKPINNHYIIVILFILLLVYILSFAVGMTGAWCPTENTAICSAVLNVARVFSVLLFVLAVCLFVNWIRMKNQLQKFRGDIETFNVLYKTVKKAIPPAQ
jgi:hypothetical protein